MLLIEPRRRVRGDEELRPVRVRTGICHATVYGLQETTRVV
jgi:hypothetical protein